MVRMDSASSRARAGVRGGHAHGAETDATDVEGSELMCFTVVLLLRAGSVTFIVHRCRGFDRAGRLRWPIVARFHVATITPTKAELIAEWAPTQPWGPAADVPIEVIGSYRFDDPDGRVGMETHLVTAGGTLLQIPLTYRDEPLEGADDALITEMQHSVLGTRWVYDGLRDPRLVVMLAAVAMTGQGEALGLAEYDGRWYIAPSNVRIQGGAGRRSECRSTVSKSHTTTRRLPCSATTGSS